MTAEPKLRVIIIGSGLAGLAAARILREHHDVMVYERGDESVATGGQGIIIAPNAVKILESVGYERERAGAVPILGIRTYNKDGIMQEDVDLQGKIRFGADSYAQKRSDFREELLRLATAPSKNLGIGGEPAEIVFGKGVVDIESEEGIVTLSDGLKVTGDVIIGKCLLHLSIIVPKINEVVADGVHSRLRKIITGDPNLAAKKTGLTCYRVAVSTHDARKALGGKALPHWWDPSTCDHRSSIIVAADGTARVVTAYPIRGKEAFNISCIIKTQESTKSTTESWHAEGDLGKMLDTFGDFHETLRIVLRYDDCSIY